MLEGEICIWKEFLPGYMDGNLLGKEGSRVVPRALASGVAFGMGLFSGNGSLGTRKHQAFSVISESHASDIMLKFHDCYHNYKVSGVRGVQIQTDLN
ncbi:Multiple inositol polyphosphate phosphatase PhyIIa protein [Arachis hypogaea]|nr:Multiple inositol polyphosphate phosphatase PhyIIa protein [Arachis hypogaea]